jgi:hypothetical protein
MHGFHDTFRVSTVDIAGIASERGATNMHCCHIVVAPLPERRISEA